MNELAVQVQTISPAIDVEVTAENADEMAQCQSAIITWCKAKVAELSGQAKELQEAYEHAVKRKWKSDTLKRHAAIAVKRVDFYSRMLTALQHGYQIVPSFPVTAFAIRTDKKKPLRMYSNYHRSSHTQEPESLPAGEGDYKNPFPLVRQGTISPATSTENEQCYYVAEQWKDLEFPISMSKPRIMEATTRAMALKIFDDIGILPGYTPNEGTRAPKGDPIIVARLKYPRLAGYNTDRFVTFILAWHLNTKDL